MYISPRPSLVCLTVDGVSVVMDSKDAKDLKKRYPTATIQRFRPRKCNSTKDGHGAVRNVPVSEYLRERND